MENLCKIIDFHDFPICLGNSGMDRIHPKFCTGSWRALRGAQAQDRVLELAPQRAALLLRSLSGSVVHRTGPPKEDVSPNVCALQQHSS